MPNQRFEGGARFSPDDANLIRFGMMAGGRLVRVDLPIPVMLAEFGASKLDPLAHFESQREVIEATASYAFGTRHESGDPLVMTEVDFETEASRSYMAAKDMF